MRTFKDIQLLHSISELCEQQRATAGLAYMLQVTRGHLQTTYADCAYRLQEDDLLFGAVGNRLQDANPSEDFACTIYAIDVRTLDDILYACLRDEQGWIEKSRYLLKHPVIHLSKRQVEMIDAYRVLVRFYSDERNHYERRVAFLQAQAIIFELLSWVSEAMSAQSGLPAAQPASASSSQTTPTDTRARQLYLQFHRLVNDTHGVQRQVRWYAQQIHITPGYLHQICKQVDGRPPQIIINNIVLHEIQQCLLATDDSVKQIAFALHFGTESSFSKFFRKQTGMSPTEYRARM
ncbi:MAG: helix-turn-helix domain-containing protein [Paludibacteraceae bacterium]